MMTAKEHEEKCDPGVVNPAFVTDLEDDVDIDKDEISSKRSEGDGMSDTDSVTSMDSSCSVEGTKFNLKMSPRPMRRSHRSKSEQHSPDSYRSSYQSNRSSVCSTRKGILKKTASSTTINMEMNNISQPQTPTENGHTSRFKDPSLDDNCSNGDVPRFVRSTTDAPLHNHQRSFNRVKFILDSGRPDNVTGDYDDIKIEKVDRSSMSSDRSKDSEKEDMGLSNSGRKCLIFTAAILLLTMAVVLGSLFGSRKLNNLPTKSLLYPSIEKKYIRNAIEGRFKITNKDFIESFHNFESKEFKKFSKEIEALLFKVINHEAVKNPTNSTVVLRVIKLSKGSVVPVFRIKWENKDRLSDTEIRKRIMRHLDKFGSSIADYKVDKKSVSVARLKNGCHKGVSGCSHTCVFSDQTLRFLCTCPDTHVLTNKTVCSIPPESTTRKMPFIVPPVVNNIIKDSGAQFHSVNPETREKKPEPVEEEKKAESLEKPKVTSESKNATKTIQPEKANQPKDKSKSEEKDKPTSSSSPPPSPVTDNEIKVANKTTSEITKKTEPTTKQSTETTKKATETTAKPEPQQTSTLTKEPIESTTLATTKSKSTVVTTLSKATSSTTQSSTIESSSSEQSLSSSTPKISTATKPKDSIRSTTKTELSTTKQTEVSSEKSASSTEISTQASENITSSKDLSTADNVKEIATVDNEIISSTTFSVSNVSDSTESSISKSIYDDTADTSPQLDTSTKDLTTNNNISSSTFTVEITSELPIDEYNASESKSFVNETLPVNIFANQTNEEKIKFDVNINKTESAEENEVIKTEVNTEAEVVTVKSIPFDVIKTTSPPLLTAFTKATSHNILPGNLTTLATTATSNSSVTEPKIVISSTPIHVTTTEKTEIMCDENKFQCVEGSSRYGRCIPKSSRCDSIYDCYDRSDEEDCISNKCYGNYQCWNGDCIDRKYVCDGIKHCDNGGDEEACETWLCTEEEFKCESKEGKVCIHASQKCDGHSDCFDSSDERNCSTTCSSDQFLCPGDNWCIPNLWKCNGINDCSGGEDELNCDCEGLDQSPCVVGGCVPTFKLCDGLRQCPDGSDEYGCLRIDDESKQLEIRSEEKRWSPVCGDKWTNGWTELVCEQLGLGEAISTEVKRVNESVPRPRVKLSPDAPKVAQRGRAPLQYFLTPGECSADPLVHVSCKQPTCGNWNRVSTGSQNSDIDPAWPSLGILIQPGTYEDIHLAFAHSCAATALTPVWVIASYSCLLSKPNGLEADNWAFLIGESSPRVGKKITQLRHAKQIVVYHGAKRVNGIWNGDAALLRLQSPLSLDESTKLACLPNRPAGSHSHCKIASWQHVNKDDHEDVIQSVQKLPVPNLTAKTCNTSYYKGQLTNSHLCASFLQPSHSPCLGKEGSALMCKSETGSWELHGLLSLTSTCARFEIPSLFTDIIFIRDWISNTVEKVNNTAIKAEGKALLRSLPGDYEVKKEEEIAIS